MPTTYFKADAMTFEIDKVRVKGVETSNERHFETFDSARDWLLLKLVSKRKNLQEILKTFDAGESNLRSMREEDVWHERTD